MAFTRFTTSVANILGLLNKPTETPTQLKTKFDKAGTDIKTAVNGLMDELEDTDAATFIGAGAISEADESEPNVQAKLDFLHEEIAGVSQGAIPDNSITEAKLVTTYSSTLAKKDTTLQTGLNSEKLGGKTKAEVIAEAQTYTLTDTETTHSGLVPASTVTITLPTNAKFIRFILLPDASTTGTAQSSSLYDIDITNKKILIGSTNEGDIKINREASSDTIVTLFKAGDAYLNASWLINGSNQLVITFSENMSGTPTFSIKTRIIEVFGR
jgi:hypothetical protein